MFCHLATSSENRRQAGALSSNCAVLIISLATVADNMKNSSENSLGAPLILACILTI